MIPLLCLRNADKEHTACSAYCQDSVCNGAHIQAAVSFLSGSYRKLCCHLVATCKTATYHLILKVKKLMEHEIVKQTERSASFSYLLIFIPSKRPEHKASEAQSQSNNEASSWAHICTLSCPFMRHSYSKQIPVIRTISMTCQHKAVQFYRLTN